MISINPLDVFLWTFRRNEKDTVNLYNTLSPVMQLATGGSMLNFGYWSSDHSEPIPAQENLCVVFANLAELSSAKHVVDVGSGLSAPSHLWQQKFPDISLYDVNINYSQLSFGKKQKIEFLNSSSTKLPFTNNSVDRVLALESAQHFKPLSDFISESKRVLTNSGLLVMAIPVTLGNSSLKDLGMLKFTWSSEHYSLDDVKNTVQSHGFEIKHEQLIGNFVYDPLADYYVENREHLKKSILEKYPNYVENILYKSIIKMKTASQNGIIDYVLLKCIPETRR
ncbi:erythromycin 3''-O-methyltransferase protein [Marine Group I thaumarchaeote SCGC AAA799-E16]|uniref:Erythromycin 3''-O-methyltransferase protein n=5 Tax=Marine Group I TaxID=905826 RepID=A0A087S192_9ARCH|nr:erythromycin 3''-O-methyltransferase protein [Marine Group I thaumarchaeote SCGC AAA799-N04]KER05934.1 erythromycin 3''-O-methyltransferase protein [Marine Group I thaumarchaeote SCGC AAA799-E16]KFM16037.1 erythromycin 3''-O-methyltransferase protein [Marine Group I thaumarchaeote SCGC AAA799-D11]KFM17774.1 tocopherol O-methyltransferase protein [Marine Group I thaumarchaeote SCGC RSA3]KFM19496.1 erythromycin 3''-O-methyltransferase protein [Marine Group I thaumarchaeote SCGC AAA799-P11]